MYSGKLHREFHYGPDETKEDSSSDSTPEKIEVMSCIFYFNVHKMIWRITARYIVNNNAMIFFQIDRETGERLPSRDINASPPPSQFANLGPSRNRYTLLHDEF